MNGSALYETFARAPLAFERGEGSWLVTESGERYLDFAGGIAVNSLGHSHPHLVAALTEQAARLWHVSNLYEIPGQRRLGERLVEATFADKVFFTNSGAEALECAIKTARRYQYVSGHPERFRIVTFEGAFHGRTLATIAAGGQAKYLEGFGPKVDGFDQVPFGDEAALRAAITDDTAGILLEPVQGEGGLRGFPEEFMRMLRQICDEKGLLLILDEVQTGIGRCGTLLAEEYYGVRADIIALGKGLGGGVPLAALLARGKACCFEVGELEGTHHGNALMACAGGAVLDAVLGHGFFEHVRESGCYLGEGLARLAYRYGHGQLRGHGLMWGLTLSDDSADAVVKAALDEGLILNAPQPNCLRFTPALTVSKSNIDEMLLRLGHAFSRVRTAQLQCRKGIAV